MNILPVAGGAPAGVLERVIGVMSILTMIATVPQAVNVWSTRGGASGVSLISWLAYLVAACLWLVHGLRKRDPSIYLACIGWIFLDAAIVIGILVRQW
ncbi:MAG TPA: hypothetical protein VL284_04840 [Thermoanaerobaculia bacterium]|nr:hypothetical protein [Thermoanaerobaculia bacterium]